MDWRLIEARDVPFYYILGMLFVSGLIGSGLGRLIGDPGIAKCVGGFVGVLFAIVGMTCLGFAWSSHMVWVGVIAYCCVSSASVTSKARQVG